MKIVVLVLIEDFFYMEFYKVLSGMFLQEIFFVII